MRFYKLIINAAVISILNIVSFSIGVLGVTLLKPTEHFAVQIPLTITTGVLLVVAWILLGQRHHGLVKGEHFMLVFILAFPVGGVLVMIIHFLTQGGVPSAGFLAATVPLQFAENVIGLPVAVALASRRRKSETKLGEASN